mgnify:CR=1 FL=1
MTHTERLEGDTTGDTLEDSKLCKKMARRIPNKQKNTRHTVRLDGGITEYTTILSEDSHTLITSSDIAERPFGPKVSH